MIQAMVAGVRLADLGRDVGRQLPALLHREAQFLLDPIPNLYFTRDPFAAIGRGASVHRMFSETRARETLLEISSCDIIRILQARCPCIIPGRPLFPWRGGIS